MVFHFLILSSTVQNIGISCISYPSVHFYGYITNSQNDQLPVGLIAQFEERCTDITEVIGSNPIQAWFFFQAFFSQLFESELHTQTALVFHLLILSSTVQTLEFHVFTFQYF